jgi:hypothetical protein
MTSKRDLGPILAIIAAAVAIIAVVAGFIVIGGPGDARDKRIDHYRLSVVAEVAHTAICAYAIAGEAPASIAEAYDVTYGTTVLPDDDRCRGFNRDFAWSAPAAEYRKIDAARIEVCQIFLRANTAPAQINDPILPDVYYPEGPFGMRELAAARPSAGRHCYEFNLAPPPATPG